MATKRGERATKDGPDALEQNAAPLSSLLDRRRTGWMEKRFEHWQTGTSWLPRYAVLTVDRLVFAKSEDDDDRIVDYIPLAEIVSVEIANGLKDDFSSPLASPASRGGGVPGSSQRQLPVHQEQSEPHLVIRTIESGHNSGRAYIHRLPNEDAARWHSDLKLLCAQAKLAAERDAHANRLSYFRAKMLSHYEAKRTQLLIALVITCAFAVDVSEAQLLPAEGTEEAFIFLVIEIIITSFFTLELLFHVMCKSNNCFRPFWSRKMNLFDMVVVVVSIVSLTLQLTSSRVPSLKMLRLVRVVRVLRLFKRLRSLNKITKAIISSLLPVCNSLFILLVLSCLSVWVFDRL